jgi:hypothetical protein
MPELTEAEARLSLRSGSRTFAFESLNRTLRTMCRHAGGSTRMREKLSAVIAWAEDGRAIAVVEFVLKVTGLHHSTDDERRRFDEILADRPCLSVMVRLPVSK